MTYKMKLSAKNMQLSLLAGIGIAEGLSDTKRV